VALLSATESSARVLVFVNQSATAKNSKKGLLHDRVTGWVTQPEWLTRS
jgi:hypothetical protein